MSSIQEGILRADTVKEAVFLALGAVSVCWENIDKAGTFDSSHAQEIGDALMDKIHLHVSRLL